VQPESSRPELPGLPTPHSGLRPAHTCARLLAALEASEGRRRKRKRDTTPDAIGLAIKRRLLEGAVRDDPDPDEFERWLLTHIETEYARATGPARAMALDVLADFRLASSSEAFRSWLEQGAPSDDASG
jgi:hypothetical protein